MHTTEQSQRTCESYDVGTLPASQFILQTTLPPAAPPGRRTTVAPRFLTTQYSISAILWVGTPLRLWQLGLQGSFPMLVTCTSSFWHGYSHICPSSKSCLYSLEMMTVRIKYIHTCICIYVSVLLLKYVHQRSMCSKCNPHICMLMVFGGRALRD